MANNQARENKMGTMPVGKLLATMAIPMMVSMLFQAFYNIVDSVYVSRLSQDAMNAVSLAFPLQTLMIAFSGGTNVGMNALLSRSLGEKRQDLADRAANTTAFLVLCNYIGFALIGILFGGPFFRIQTQNPVIVKYGTEYVTVCLCCSFFLFCQMYVERLLQSTGRSHLSMIPQVLGAVTNMIMDPILIFGLYGFPRLEVMGAAVATIFGQTLATCIGLFMNLKMNPDIHLNFKQMRPHGETIKEIYRIGLPSIVMQSIGSLTTFVMNHILIGFTEAATAVYGAYFKLQSFIFMPVFGLNGATVPIIAFNFGAARWDRLKKAAKYSIMSAITILLVGLLLFETIPGVLLSLFSPSEEMLSIGTVALRLIATHYLFAGFCIIAGSICQAIGNPTHSLIIAACRQLVVLLPSAYLLSLTGNLNMVWLCFPISEIVSFTLSVIFFRQTMKNARKQIELRAENAKNME